LAEPRIRPVDDLVLGERSRIAAEGDPALLDQVEMMRDPQRHVRVLLDEEDRRAVAVQLADDAEDLLDYERRETERRLVHQQQLRAAHQRARHRKHLLLAARERAALLAGALAQPREAGEQALDVRRDSVPVIALVGARRADSRAPSCAGTRADSPGTSAMPRSTMPCGAAPAISLPMNRIEPERGRRMPAVVIISVVLPAPFGPSRQVIDPCSTWSDTPRSASILP
jgi:hypothetical protein